MTDHLTPVIVGLFGAGVSSFPAWWAGLLLMRPTVHLVNTARAGLDDESMLVDALRIRQDASHKVPAAPAPLPASVPTTT
ncbi:hypothetical protein BIV25_22985 [Streptomyces sp. MUSC 14]|nr:hypothetical protein BIV25_22985 [Streptomyces sp. MUSC 14]